MIRRRVTPPRQQEFQFKTWGGKREGAGRPPTNDKAGLKHERRTPVSGNEPMHVTMRIARGLPPLRTRKYYAVVKMAIELASKRADFAVVHYSVQRDHLHLIVEADGTGSLARGIQSLTCRLARNLNKLLGRRGPVFSDRYHLHVLTSPRETANCLHYVLNNTRRHAKKEGVALERDFVDPMSSSFNFDGWSNFPPAPKTWGYTPPVLPEATTWLLRKGWQKYGPFDIRRVPGGV